MFFAFLRSWNNHGGFNSVFCYYIFVDEGRTKKEALDPYFLEKACLLILKIRLYIIRTLYSTDLCTTSFKIMQLINI